MRRKGNWVEIELKKMKKDKENEDGDGGTMVLDEEKGFVIEN